MANNYLQPVNNHFDDELEDVDDDIFLNNSRTSTSGRGSSAKLCERSTNPFEDPQQTYAEKRRQIEQRTLESSEKSLGLLYETEEVGKATAVELAKQREQLERTSRNLDDINTSLRFSQRHLNGLKSIFGGLKNYISGNREAPLSRSNSAVGGGSSFANDGIANNSLANDATSMSNTISNNVKPAAAMSPTLERYDNPVNRMRNDTSSTHLQQQQQQRSKNPFESQLEANLEEMCGNLSRLKNLATDLGSEIESQNDLLDNMNYKIEDVDVKIVKQNKDMNKLLGKK